MVDSVLIYEFADKWRQLPEENRKQWEQVLDSVHPPSLLLQLISPQLELTDLRQLSDLISTDAMLAARVVGAANSARISPAHEVTSLNQALTLLGMFAARLISTNYLLEQYYAKLAPNHPEFLSFLQRWLAVASVVTYHWAYAVELQEADTLATATLVSRLGTIMMVRAPEFSVHDYAQNSDELWREQFEEDKASITTPLLSGEQLRRWGVAERLVLLVANQRRPMARNLPSGTESAEAAVIAASLVVGEQLLTDRAIRLGHTLVAPSYFALRKNLTQNELFQPLETLVHNPEFAADLKAVLD